MSFHSWLQKLRSAFAPCRTQRRGSLKAAPPRLNLEILEDRNLLSFSPAVSYPAGISPVAIVTADFNGDSRLDIATANAGDNTVSVLLGNANGTFQPPQTSATGAGPVSVAVGDFDGDGNLDLATADNGGANVSVLLGKGDGTFEAPSGISLDSTPTSVAVGDFDGDGKMDLGVTSNVYTPGYYGPGYWGYYGYYPGNWYPGYLEGRANVLLGNGDGSFAGPNTTWLGAGTHNAALAADLNGDGFDDFATLNADYGYVSVLLGDSSGYLQGPSAFATGYYSNALAAGDLDADGDLDLVTTNYEGVWLLPGDGSGGFATPQNYGAGNGAASVVLGDFNRDTHLDIATANAPGDSISILRGRADGAFLTVETFSAGPGAYALTAGDFNGDGWLDAATNANGNSASVLLNDQTWPFVPPPVSVSDAAAVTEGNSGTVNATFTLTLAYASIYDVTVHYVTADLSAAAGSDYVAASADVIIPAGHTSATFTVAVKGDHVAEPTETFAVNLNAATNATIGHGQGIGAILDDEPLISINDSSVTEGNTGTRPATFTVNLSAAYDEPVVIGYTTANGTATAGSDYQVASGTLTIPAGQTNGTFTVLVNGDRAGEPNETFLVNLSSPSNAAIADGQGEGTIVDDEPRISINDTSVTEGHTGTRPATFTVNLSAAYDVPVVIGYATANGTATAGSDYQAASSTLTIPAGLTSGTFTVMVNGDKTGEPNETFLVNLSNPSNAVIADGQGAGTIVDDEPRVSINDVTRAEGSKGQNTQFTFTVTLSAAYDQTVTLSFRTVNGTATTGNKDYVAKTGTLTFKPGETTKTITITVKGDPYPGRDETFYVDLFGLSSNAQFSKSRGIGTILNDD